MYLFFDCESTGLPRNFKAPLTDGSNWPRLVSLSWEMYSEDGIRKEWTEYVIKPFGFVIPTTSTAIHHITTEEALLKGFDRRGVLEHFYRDLTRANVIVAHNIEFDYKVIAAEYYRLGINPVLLIEHHQACTMELGRDVCQLPGKFGFKWPKLAELYFHLFGEEIKDQHNSAADVAACARCYFEMLRLAKLETL